MIASPYLALLATSPAGQRFSGRPTIGILSTYAPTVCGLATFSAALAGGLMVAGIDVGVVRVADGTVSQRSAVVGELVSGSPSSAATATALLNRRDVAVIQHEYGIYGGLDGADVVTVMKGLTVPTIAILHTVLTAPTSHQRCVLEQVTFCADQVVVMSEAARARLLAGYAVEHRKISVIPHGTHLPAGAAPKRSGRPTLLTWGLIGPGKGIERVIDAMASLRDLSQQPRYLIAGRTHPKVLAAHGEAYRDSLIARAARLGVTDSVFFDATYRTPKGLTELMQAAAVVVLPYDSTEQVTSGVLVDSLASGRPIVATAFPHAIELLGDGAGCLVAHDDAGALVAVLRRLLTDPRIAGTMASQARHVAPAMAWPVVADTYLNLARRLVAARSASA